MPDRSFFSLFPTLVLLLGLIGLFPLSLNAQGTEANNTSTATAEEVQQETVGEALSRFFSSFPDPRTGSRDVVLRDAVPMMEFEGALALLSDREKRNFAFRLKDVIDRLRFFDEAEVNAEVGNARVYVLTTTPSGFPVQLRLNEENRWVFTARTVENINNMLSDVATLARIDNVVPIGDQELSLGTQIELLVPEQFRRTFLILRVWQWIGLFVLIVLGVLADRTVTMFSALFARYLLGRISMELDEREKRAALRPLGILAMGIVWFVGINALNLPTTSYAILLVAVKFVIGLSFVWAAMSAVDLVTSTLSRKAKQSQTRYDELVIPFFNRVAKIFVFVFGVVFVAQNIGVDMTSLIAGLGIGGLAFALAAKDTVENVFGSLTVMIDRPFRVGDWICLEGNLEGTVEKVGLRSTRIRTFYNSLITLPNAKLISSPVDNLGMRRYRRWRTMLSVTYDTPPEKIEAFCEAIRELIRQHPYTRKDFYLVYVNEFNSASLDILVYMFFDAPDWTTELRERHRLFLDILRVSKATGVEFAFPTQTLHLVKDMPTHADAPKDAEEALQRGILEAQEILRRQYGTVTVPKDGKPLSPRYPGGSGGGEQSEQGLS